MEGEALYWNVFEKNEIRLVNVTGTEMTEEQVPAMYRHLIPVRLYKRFSVGEGETGLLYIDGKFEKQLSSGTYFYWIYAHEVSMKLYSLKVQQLEISGQEILTSDKVGVRLNILCSYRITRPLELMQKTDNVANLLYTRIQLLAREYIGGFRLDELLAQKEEIGRFLMKQIQGTQEEYCVETVSYTHLDVYKRQPQVRDGYSNNWAAREHWSFRSSIGETGPFVLKQKDMIYSVPLRK